jgi:hypothetical protein
MSVYLVPVLVAVSSFGVLWWGWSLGGDGIPFARSGALVTGISIAFLFFQHGRILAERQKLIGEEVREQISAMKLSNEDSELQVKFIDEQIQFDAWLTDLMITICQGSVIWFGTLVWGFGDLVYQYRSLPWPEILWKLIHLGAQNSAP